MTPTPSSDSRIHIALTFDDNFWAPAYATMRSICLTTRRRSDLVFHLCHLPLSAEHRADLMKIGTEFGVGIFFYDLTQTPRFRDVMGRVPFHKRLTDIVYARFVLDSFLPEEVKKVIYLDCDMMVMAPIEELWETDLGGKPAGAVPDPWGKLIGSGRDLRATRDLLDPSDPYFNAGLLVIDIHRWRCVKVFDKLVSLIESGTIDRLKFSQNVINLILNNNWHALDALWNVVDPNVAHVALSPKNLHYTGNSRPWTLSARLRGVGYARIYRHVMTNALFYKFLRFRIKKSLQRYWPVKPRASGHAAVRKPMTRSTA